MLSLSHTHTYMMTTVKSHYFIIDSERKFMLGLGKLLHLVPSRTPLSPSRLLGWRKHTHQRSRCKLRTRGPRSDPPDPPVPTRPRWRVLCSRLGVWWAANWVLLPVWIVHGLTRSSAYFLTHPPRDFCPRRRSPGYLGVCVVRVRVAAKLTD